MPGEQGNLPGWNPRPDLGDNVYEIDFLKSFEGYDGQPHDDLPEGFEVTDAALYEELLGLPEEDEKESK